MLDRFIFENHLGQRFEGLPNSVYLNYNDLRDYSWSYDTINSRISRFHRPVKDRKIPLVVYCQSDEEAIAVKNRLMDLAEADIAAVLPGKVYIGDYYTNGWITASKKSNYLINKRYCEIELTLTSDDPAWYREQTHVFVSSVESEPAIDVDATITSDTVIVNGDGVNATIEDDTLTVRNDGIYATIADSNLIVKTVIDSGDNGDGTLIVKGDGTDYPYDYAYGYALSMTGRSVTCGAVGTSAFRLLIYGEAVNPSVVIGGHIYAINGTVGKGETLLIDGLNKTITLTTVTGTKVNWFDKRGRKDYIFEPIPAGQNTVAWSDSFGFDLTIIEKRSEPRWT